MRLTKYFVVITNLVVLVFVAFPSATLGDAYYDLVSQRLVVEKFDGGSVRESNKNQFFAAVGEQLLSFHNDKNHLLSLKEDTVFVYDDNIHNDAVAGPNIYAASISGGSMVFMPIPYRINSVPPASEEYRACQAYQSSPNIFLVNSYGIMVEVKCHRGNTGNVGPVLVLEQFIRVPYDHSTSKFKIPREDFVNIFLKACSRLKPSKGCDWSVGGSIVDGKFTWRHLGYGTAQVLASVVESRLPSPTEASVNVTNRTFNFVREVSNGKVFLDMNPAHTFLVKRQVAWQSSRVAVRPTSTINRSPSVLQSRAVQSTRFVVKAERLKAYHFRNNEEVVDSSEARRNKRKFVDVVGEQLDDLYNRNVLPQQRTCAFVFDKEDGDGTNGGPNIYAAYLSRDDLIFVPIPYIVKNARHGEEKNACLFFQQDGKKRDVDLLNSCGVVTKVACSGTYGSYRSIEVYQQYITISRREPNKSYAVPTTSFGNVFKIACELLKRRDCGYEVSGSFVDPSLWKTGRGGTTVRLSSDSSSKSNVGVLKFSNHTPNIIEINGRNTLNRPVFYDISHCLNFVLSPE